MTLVFRCTTIALIFLMHANAHAGIYKCVDGNGRLIFQAHPCEEGQAQTTIEERKEPSNNTAKGDSIVGDWIERDDPDDGVITIDASGNVDVRPSNGPRMSGSWSETGENQYALDLFFAGVDLSSTIVYQPESDQLIINMAGASASVFIRR